MRIDDFEKLKKAGRAQESQQKWFDFVQLYLNDKWCESSRNLGCLTSMWRMEINHNMNKLQNKGARFEVWSLAKISLEFCNITNSKIYKCVLGAYSLLFNLYWWGSLFIVLLISRWLCARGTQWPHWIGRTWAEFWKYLWWIASRQKEKSDVKTKQH